MKQKRHKTIKVKIGELEIGGNAPVRVESMVNVSPYNPAEIIKQINELEKAGCELVRITLPDEKSTEYISNIKKNTRIPIMGDIHFDYKIAVKAIENGIDALRLNPGNIRDKNKLKEVVKRVKDKNMVVRIGVNSGSINRSKYKEVTPDAMVDSAFEHIELFEAYNFTNIIVSLKATDVLTTIESYKKFIKLRNYPLHIGITEAGTQFTGSIKSSVGLGILLYEGIGDTLRVSLSGDPVVEVIVGYKILQSLRLREHGIEVIACPTCGRAEIDVEKIALEIEKRSADIEKNIKVAVLGCIVNGLGEAGDADVGIAGTKNESILFKNGKIIKKVKNSELIDELLKLIREL